MSKRKNLDPWRRAQWGGGGGASDHVVTTCSEFKIIWLKAEQDTKQLTSYLTNSFAKIVGWDRGILCTILFSIYR